jgi:hypothetical protein
MRHDSQITTALPYMMKPNPEPGKASKGGRKMTWRQQRC